MTAMEDDEENSSRGIIDVSRAFNYKMVLHPPLHFASGRVFFMLLRSVITRFVLYAYFIYVHTGAASALYILAGC